MAVVGPVILDGEAVPLEDARISVTDVGLLRGYGIFEVMRAYGGRIFRLGAHLDRLERSAELTGIPLPARDDLAAWCTDRGAEGDVSVRLVVTGGSDMDALGTGMSVIVYAEEFPGLRPSMRLTVKQAPWHSDGAGFELTGAKTLSYGPNMAVDRAAREQGFDGPVLVGRSGNVLEGPHFTIAWVVDGIVETPTLDLGLLDSITRQAMLDVAARLGVSVVEAVFPVDRLFGADEVFAMSTTKDITPVTGIDHVEYPIGDVTRRFVDGFGELVASEIA